MNNKEKYARDFLDKYLVEIDYEDLYKGDDNILKVKYDKAGVDLHCFKYIKVNDDHLELINDGYSFMNKVYFYNLESLELFKKV